MSKDLLSSIFSESNSGFGPIYSKSADFLARFTGLTAPFILIFYAGLAYFNLVSVRYRVDVLGAAILFASGIAHGIVQFLVPVKSKIYLMIVLLGYHLFAGAFFIFYSGFSSPLVVIIISVVLSFYIYFSTFGVQLSVLLISTTIAIDTIFWNNLDPKVTANNFIVLTGIIAISILFILILHRFQKAAKLSIDKTKMQENLQRDRVSTIINNMAYAVISTDANGIINVYNAASLSLLDTNKSFMGKNIKDVLPVHDKDDKNVDILEELLASNKVSRRDDLFYSFSDDDKMRLEITYAPIRKAFSKVSKSEENDGYILIMQDITKEKSLEEERDEFVSVVSHELRTPITIAEGTISNIQAMMDHPSATNVMIKDAINVAHDQVVYLANMVNDLSTLSRAEHGMPDPPIDIDISELAHSLYNKFINEIKAKKLHLDLDLHNTSGKIHVSQIYIDELLQNLMTNAVKYTKKGHITIDVNTKADQVTFSIQDTGIGISKSDQVKVFDKFYRSEDYRTRETGGTGLGLYIATKLARQLGTKINLVSRLNFGSTFSFTLPIKKEQVLAES